MLRNPTRVHRDMDGIKDPGPAAIRRRQLKSRQCQMEVYHEITGLSKFGSPREAYEAHHLQSEQLHFCSSAGSGTLIPRS